jgi:hypothetical protein
MPITPNNPFKGRQHPGELIILCVRWYLQYPGRRRSVESMIGTRIPAHARYEHVRGFPSARLLEDRPVPF